MVVDLSFRGIFPLFSYWACLLCCVMAGANATAQEPAELPQRVRQYVRQLDSPQRAQREAAEQLLRRLGPAILPLLPEPNVTSSAESRQRLGNVRQFLERQASARSLGGSTVTLRGEYSLSQALASLAEQTGNSLRADFNRLPTEATDIPIQVDFSAAPYWQAVDELLDQAGLQFDSYSVPPTELVVAPRAPDQLPRRGQAAYSGPFRIEATGIEAQVDLRQPTSSRLRLRMEILWEPQLVPLQISQKLSDIQAVDDRGQPLTVAATGTLQVPVPPTVAGIPLQVPFQLPDPQARRMATCRGRLLALLAGPVQTFTFQDLTGRLGQWQQRAGLSVRLQRVVQDEKSCRLLFQLRVPDGSVVLASHLDPYFDNRATLIAPDGSRLEDPQIRRFLEKPSEIGFEYRFPPVRDLQGYSCEYQARTPAIEVPVDYELRDIPLP